MASAPLAHRNAEFIDSHDKKLRKILGGTKISAAPMPKDIVSFYDWAFLAVQSC